MGNKNIKNRLSLTQDDEIIGFMCISKHFIFNLSNNE
tara:strand:- start:257 stop:367 length:111 start_codon:yes stop_codon:yes gene_type:complete